MIKKKNQACATFQHLKYFYVHYCKVARVEKYIWIVEKKQNLKCGFMLNHLEHLSYQTTKDTQ